MKEKLSWNVILCWIGILVWLYIFWLGFQPNEEIQGIKSSLFVALPILVILLSVVNIIKNKSKISIANLILSFALIVIGAIIFLSAQY